MEQLGNYLQEILTFVGHLIESRKDTCNHSAANFQDGVKSEQSFIAGNGHQELGVAFFGRTRRIDQACKDGKCT